MIIFYNTTKLLIKELTVTWEECMEEANKQKHAKYQEEGHYVYYRCFRQSQQVTLAEKGGHVVYYCWNASWGLFTSDSQARVSDVGILETLDDHRIVPENASQCIHWIYC